MEVRTLIRSGDTYTREELCLLTGKDDRAIRSEIRSLRREGIPILGLPQGGYKLAYTDAEKNEMLHQIKGRALDLLRTHSLMAKAMQIDGQITFKEICDAMETRQ